MLYQGECFTLYIFQIPQKAFYCICRFLRFQQVPSLWTRVPRFEYISDGQLIVQLHERTAHGNRSSGSVFSIIDVLDATSHNMVKKIMKEYFGLINPGTWGFTDVANENVFKFVFPSSPLLYRFMGLIDWFKDNVISWSASRMNRSSLKDLFNNKVVVSICLRSD